MTKSKSKSRARSKPKSGPKSRSKPSPKSRTASKSRTRARSTASSRIKSKPKRPPKPAKPKPSSAEAREDRLWNAWIPVCEWAAYELSRDAAEIAPLRRLAKYPNTLAALAVAECEQEDPQLRSIGAVIAGLLTEDTGGLLKLVWKKEVDRLNSGAEEPIIAIMGANSVAERIISAAERWCRVPERREEAMEVLEDLIGQFVKGVEWNGMIDALSVIARHDPARAAKQFKPLRNCGRVDNQMPRLDGIEGGDREDIDNFVHFSVDMADQHAREFATPAEWNRKLAALEKVMAEFESAHLAGGRG